LTESFDLSGANFVAGSALALPFADDSFDAVCLFDVIEHLPRGTEPKALREACRVLRPNGKLYLSTPHASPLHTVLDPLLIFGHRHYRRPSVRRLAFEAGFIVDKLYVAGNVFECLDFIRLLAYRYVLGRWPPELPFVTRLIEKGYGHDKRLGMTVFLVGHARKA
jgi:SAM-dependent methyltransferase